MEKEKITYLQRNMKNIVDIILIVALLVLSIKKGGFYKTDSLVFNLIVVAMGTIYLIGLTWIERKRAKEKGFSLKIDPVSLLLLGLFISYFLPVLFRNTAVLADSIEEMIRYFVLYLIYQIVKRSDHKNCYVYAILTITLVQVMIGIDGLGLRYLQGILGKLNSGFLTQINLTRMSGTIQYANVFAILCAISLFFTWNIMKQRIMAKKVTSLKGKLVFAVLGLLCSSYCSGILLSGSRTVIVLVLLFAAIMFFLHRQRNGRSLRSSMLVTVVLSLIYTSVLLSQIQVEPNLIYGTSVIASLLCFGVFFILSYAVIKWENGNNKMSTKKVWMVWVSGCLLMLTFLLLAMQMKVPISLSSDSLEKEVTRNIYAFEKEKNNNMKIKIKKIEEDTRYQIRMIAVNKKNESSLIAEYHYYNTTSDTFSIDYLPQEDISYIRVTIICEKGSLKVVQCLLNEKINYLNYLLLPSHTMYRLLENSVQNASDWQRLYFYEDAIKLATLSPCNLLVGIGGDGFKEAYGTVQTHPYTSTEVHSVYLQLLVESGLIGCSLFIILLWLIVKRSKAGMYRFVLLLFCIHSLVDLNFSFLFMMGIFAVLLALQEEERMVPENTKKWNVCYYIEKTVAISVGVILVVVLIKANMAYEMEIPSYTQDQLTFQKQIEVVTDHEKRVSLDPYEKGYRLALHQEYNRYLSYITQYLSQTGVSTTSQQLTLEYQNVLQNSKRNMNSLKKQNRFNKDVLFDVCDGIFQHLKEFVDAKYPNNKEEGYEYYLSQIIQLLADIEDSSYQETAKTTIKEKAKQYAVQLENNKEALGSKVVEKYIEAFHEISNK